MAAGRQVDVDPEVEPAQILTLTLRACEIAKSAVANTAEGLAKRSAAPLRRVKECAEQLERLERQVAGRVASAISGAPAAQMRELLACMKFMIHLERLGDHAWSVACQAEALDSGVSREDVHDLITMASTLESMVVDVHHAFSGRDLERATALFRAHSEIDHLRDLMFARHLDNRELSAGPDSIQVLLMAESLARAGDHAKDLAEEICRLLGGHTIRHAPPSPKA